MSIIILYTRYATILLRGLYFVLELRFFRKIKIVLIRLHLKRVVLTNIILFYTHYVRCMEMSCKRDIVERNLTVDWIYELDVQRVSTVQVKY